MFESECKMFGGLNFTSPHAKTCRWVNTTGNQDTLLELCSLGSKNMEEILQPRLVLVEGASGCGISSLLAQAQSILKQRGYKVIALMQGTDADERYILSNLVEELRVPNARWSLGSDRLPLVHERVLGLRKYDFIIVDDFQRFLDLGARIFTSNLKSLSYLLQISGSCCFIIGGDSISTHAVADHLPSYHSLIHRLRPMGFDKAYIDFVRDARKQLNQCAPFSNKDMSRLYGDTKGLVGETFAYLELLKSSPLAMTAEN